jgi:hypothetical protein
MALKLGLIVFMVLGSTVLGMLGARLPPEFARAVSS